MGLRQRMTTLIRFEERFLAEIGVTEQEERAYRLLVVRGVLAVRELADGLQLSDAETTRLLDVLVSKGLASCESTLAGRFSARNPEVAIEALVLRRQAALERARSAIGVFKQAGVQDADVAGIAESDLVEVISGRD